MRYIYIFFLSAFLHPLYGQTDWQRWEKSGVSYSAGTGNNKQNEEEQKQSPGSIFLDITKSAYMFFISDLDGDNCPFHPTCSSFFIESVRTTNIFQGLLMFSDRFTRDMNLVKINRYPFTRNMRLFDPVNNYLLDSGRIKYIPPSEFANE